MGVSALNRNRTRTVLGPLAGRARDGHTLIDLDLLDTLPLLTGNEPGGYRTQQDVVNTTTDGIDLNALWALYQNVINLHNQRRNGWIGLLTFPVTELIESVQQGTGTEFELASEFGEPTSFGASVSYLQSGYDFHDYDLAQRYTWKFLRDADVRQLDALHNNVLEADNRLIFRKVMEAIYDNRTREADVQQRNYPVYPLYNGDSTVPPSYNGITFTAPHQHYLTTLALKVDSQDIEDMIEHVAHHGYGPLNGSTIVIFVNKAEAKEIRRFRLGETNNNGVVANYDFIPARTQPALIVPNEEGLLGSVPPSTWNGLNVTGSYADALIVEDELAAPQGYMFCMATGGENSPGNLVGLREHANPQYRGLRLLPGNQQAYPLVDGYYARAFGTGVRQRGAAVVMQVTTSGTYTSPEKYTRGRGLN